MRERNGNWRCETWKREMGTYWTVLYGTVWGGSDLGITRLWFNGKLSKAQNVGLSGAWTNPVTDPEPGNAQLELNQVQASPCHFYCNIGPLVSMSSFLLQRLGFLFAPHDLSLILTFRDLARSPYLVDFKIVCGRQCSPITQGSSIPYRSVDRLVHCLIVSSYSSSKGWSIA